MEQYDHTSEGPDGEEYRREDPGYFVDDPEEPIEAAITPDATDPAYPETEDLEDDILAEAETTSDFLSFRQPFDGSQPEVPLADQMAASTRLAEYTEELEELGEGTIRSGDIVVFIIGGMNEGVEVVEADVDEELVGSDDTYDYYYVRSRISYRETPPSWSINVRRYADGELGDGAKWEVYGYGETATRLDFEVPNPDEQLIRAVDDIEEAMRREESLPHVNGPRNVDVVSNLHTEREFGMRKQPVGIDEVEKLIEYVERLRRTVTKPTD